MNTFPHQLSSIEAGDRTLLADIAPAWGTGGLVVGVSGNEGVGKSSLLHYLVAGLDNVGVLALDPRARSGGALLGDRIRIGHGFIRSIASDGGGIHSRIDAMITLMRGQFDYVLIETTGTGQDQVDIWSVSHLLLFVDQPHAGDGLQAMKGGLREYADLSIHNKADLASRTSAGIMTDETGLSCWTNSLTGEGSSDICTWLQEQHHSLPLLEIEKRKKKDPHRIADLFVQQYGQAGQRWLQERAIPSIAPWVAVDVLGQAYLQS